MSYDLIFTRDRELSLREVDAHFGSRPHYQGSHGEWAYENPETGVYFSFSTGDPYAGEEFADDEPIPEPGVASFTINFNRPSFFALEAEPEVAAFVTACGLGVQDPQGGIEGDRYAAQGFQRGWDEGNAFAVRALTRRAGEPPATLPRETLHRAWRWNLGRAARQQRLGDQLFVPLTMFFRAGDTVVAAPTWVDGIPTALPDADHVLVVRDRLGQRRWRKSEREVIVVPMSTLRPVLEPVAERDTDGALVFRADPPPRPLVDFVRSLRATGEPVTAIRFDEVLDRELLTGL